MKTAVELTPQQILRIRHLQNALKPYEELQKLCNEGFHFFYHVKGDAENKEPAKSRCDVCDDDAQAVCEGCGMFTCGECWDALHKREGSDVRTRKSAIERKRIDALNEAATILCRQRDDATSMDDYCMDMLRVEDEYQQQLTQYDLDRQTADIGAVSIE